jgi:uncharacterized membrane protein YozB (DUF420 family)
MADALLPTINALLNAVAAALLTVGRVHARRGRIRAHRNTMLGAVGVSALFLLCYVLHKFLRWLGDGKMHTTLEATGAWKAAYLAMLFSHLALAMAVPVLAGVLVYLGLTDRRAAHRRLAQWAWPIWMYVSITGVAIYVVLYWG